jgi:NAD(P)-dependent dehydrogenase (short-subunit alcohol dehydrogenase family)
VVGEGDAGAGRLAGRVAIVTGAGRGIGKAIALAYARAGADLALAARTEGEIAQVATEVEALGRRALPVVADVGTEEGAKRLVAETLQRFDRTDILCNAAGQRAVMHSDALPLADWERVLTANLTASFLCSQQVFPAMREAGYGKIIMIGSMQAHSGAPFRAAYASSKTGLLGLTRALGVEWAPLGINVNMLSPGYIATEIVRHQIEIGQLNLGAIERRTPLGRIGEVEDVTGPAVFLASHESDFMVGQTLIIDGGWMANGFLQL